MLVVLVDAMSNDTGSQPILDFLHTRCDEHRMESALRVFSSKAKPRRDHQIQVLKQKLAHAQLEVDLYICALSSGHAQPTSNTRLVGGVFRLHRSCICAQCCVQTPLTPSQKSVNMKRNSIIANLLIGMCIVINFWSCYFLIKFCFPADTQDACRTQSWCGQSPSVHIVFVWFHSLDRRRDFSFLWRAHWLNV